ncbi:HtrA-like serine protease [Fulvimarina pelagi HTCC2506]|uniref:HtrA-like serine protease n=1 Tax=Fulvimarina pelagi HTCC2506 TaxID=314231 RepID=Q0G148_9HYPH|nr:trypsin-like peptidase domain-containing protein [Fulvimarina pelagi]EAU40791.1 HtrA-like serine protease [Fulvimarina pelagi HTCC2506]
MTFRAAARSAVVALCFGVLVVPSSAQDWRSGLTDRVGPSIVAVLPDLPPGEINQEEPEGTAFAIGDGRRLLTADHVLGRANSVRLRLADGTMIAAEIAVRDPETDMATLSIAEPLPALEWGPDAKPGADICVIGNAFGLGPSLTCGVVSAVERRGVGFNRVEDFVQTDAAINPGMSGAPLFAGDVGVVGMASAIFTKTSDGNLGVNFAVSARLLKAVVEDMRDGQIDRGPQGLLLRPTVGPGETGTPHAEIVRIVPGSPEAASGLTTGDRLISIEALEIAGQPDYLTALALFADRAETSYRVERDGARLNFTVTTQKRETP